MPAFLWHEVETERGIDTSKTGWNRSFEIYMFNSSSGRDL